MSIIDFGLKSRTTGVTGANDDSSRSHAILQILLRDQNGDKMGKFHLLTLQEVNAQLIQLIQINKLKLTELK